MTMAMTCTKSSPGCARRSRCRWSRALPYGHVATKATLPIGQKVGLATEPGMAHLVIDEHMG